MDYISRIYMKNLKVFSFPILMPYPEIIVVKDRRIDLFEHYGKALNETRKILEILRVEELCDEYTLLLKHRVFFLTKMLASMAQLDSILRRYALVKVRERWRAPSKWFEEFIKSLLADTFVKNSFDERVEDFVYRYKTGGRKPDMLIPIRKGHNKAIIWVVDTKHWERDFRKALGSGNERYTCLLYTSPSPRDRG